MLPFTGDQKLKRNRLLQKFNKRRHQLDQAVVNLNPTVNQQKELKKLAKNYTSEINAIVNEEADLDVNKVDRYALIRSKKYLNIKDRPVANYIHKSIIVSKFLKKFIKHGKITSSEKHINKGLLLVKQHFKNKVISDNQIDLTTILLKSTQILRPEIKLVPILKRHTKKNKRRLKFTYIPTQSPGPLWEFRIALTWLRKMILSENNSRRLHTKSQQGHVRYRRINSISRIRGFYDRFHITMPQDKFHLLIYKALTDLVSNDYIRLHQFMRAYYGRVCKSRSKVYFRWRRNKRAARK